MRKLPFFIISLLIMVLLAGCTLGQQSPSQGTNTENTEEDPNQNNSNEQPDESTNDSSSDSSDAESNNDESSDDVEPISEESFVALMVDANKRWWHFVSSRAEVEQSDFEVDGIPYIFLGEDLDTREEFIAYMGEAYTLDYIEPFMKTAEIVERDGRLARPDFDTDNNAVYEDATAELIEDMGDKKVFAHYIPCCAISAGEKVTYHVTVAYIDGQGWRVDKIQHQEVPLADPVQ